MASKILQILTIKNCWQSKKILVALGLLLHLSAMAQLDSVPLEKKFDLPRFWRLSAIGGAIYGGSVYLLSKAWYQDTPRTSFHTFNDWGEWKNMDKVGHAFTAYFETELIHRGAVWAGMDNKSALWTGAGLAMLFQGTIEVLDAYSADWGFSFYDLAFNSAGVGLYITQQALWKEQRIRMKVSSWPGSYPDEKIFSTNGEIVTSLNERIRDLFGRNLPERYLKDYNQQTIWISLNLQSFFPKSSIPKWLNIAAGYGAQEMYGGFSNRWSSDGAHFVVDRKRYGQLYLSPDIDWTRIPTESRVVRTLFSVLNLFKIPAPAIELNNRSTISFHFLHL